MLRVIHPTRIMSGDRPPNGYSRQQGNGQPPRSSHLHPNHHNGPYQQQQQHQRQQMQQHKTPPPRPLSPTQIATVYKSCTNLFLTRRLPEALATLEPIVAESASPRGKCPRALRIKVWSLYFAILDAAAKLGSEEGKKQWGSAEWRKIVQKIRTAKVWDEAVEAYTDEGRVDGDVVIALVMLLLSHAQDQKPTQKRVEAYMSASASLNQEDDPKALSQRIKLMELYVLHILPKVDEWDYAREFTQGSNDLDEEQKEQFVATLDALLEEKKEQEKLAAELDKQREAEMEAARLAEAEAHARRRDVSPSVAGSVRSSSSRRKRSPDSVRARPKSRGSVTGNRLEVPSTTAGQAGKKRTATGKDAVQARHQTSSLFGHTQALFNKMQQAMFSSQGSSLMLRTVLMLCAIIYATSKKKVRERIKKLLIVAWLKTSRTVGMGMKVTYI